MDRPDNAHLTYLPLNPADNEIRLVALQPSLQSDEISCQIIHRRFPASDAESDKQLQVLQYEALSYAWGLPSNQRQILINKIPCQVRENLWWALHHLRLRYGVRLLWIDALCINQEDVIERNHQVALMKYIYSKAERVVVWLGCETDDDHHALEFLSEIDVHSAERYINPRHQNYSLDPHARHAQRWKAILKLCEREYWQRLWIIQEVVLATKIAIYCGGNSIDWELLRRVCGQLNDLKDNLKISRYEQRLGSIEQIRGTLTTRLVQQRINLQTRSFTLFWLLKTYQQAMCLDIRDKVFGLHSLAIECCRAATPIDYSKSSFRVCGELLHHYLLHHHHEAYSDTSGYGYLDVISESQLAYRLLTRNSYRSTSQAVKTQSTSLSIIKYESTSKQVEFIKAMGYVNGAICLVAPMDLPSSDYIDVFLNPVHRLQFTNQLADQLLYLYVQKYSTEAENTYILSDLQKLKSIHTTIAYATKEYTTKDVLPPSWILESFIQNDLDSVRWHWDQESESLEHRHTLKETLEQIFSDAKRNFDTFRESNPTLPSSDINQYKLFFCQGGIIGFAPGNVLEGDLVCRFKDSDVLAIVREEKKKFVIIGRALNYLVGILPPSLTYIWERYQGPETPILFHLDFRTLRLLTS
ncbi:hypothetical protein BP6252_13839 [Coleophoma cylindrospora]|uniref:Heterokaryon incompatibility domain-containing protein n=1 Tax=Coleophoma cylindrospora TaxID=1849047 RepID=A0A3D8Q5K8_9HELO|nr:hypothetical protein BP6252_13839 [Coleophoma cylindrospora]